MIIKLKMISNINNAILNHAMKISNVLLVYTIPRTKEQESTLKSVKKILKKYKIKYKMANRDRLSKAQFQNKNLIIAVGGDGTFLRAAHFVRHQVLLGVNADVKNKEGFFMKADKNDFDVYLKKIMKNKTKIKKLPRLEAYINNKKIDALALNEFFIGSQKAYHAAKYLVSINGRSERHKSSGILITTPIGSYAWAKSCCNKTLPLNSNKYQFVVREPYERKIFKNYKLKYGILNKNKKVSVVSEMINGIIIADSVGKEYELKIGKKAIVRLSKNYLKTV